MNITATKRKKRIEVLTNLPQPGRASWSPRTLIQVYWAAQLGSSGKMLAGLIGLKFCFISIR